MRAATRDARPARRRAARRGLALTVATAALLQVAPAGWAYWSGPAVGTGTATLADLGAPADVTAHASGADVRLAWSPALLTTGTAAEGYYVLRDGAPTTCGTADAPIGATACTDLGVPDGAVTYTVVAVHRSWTATSERSAPVLVDATPPTASATVSPEPGASGYVTTRPARVDVAASDGGSGVASVTTWVGDGPRTTTPGDHAAVLLGTDGVAHVSYLATDAAGNVSAAATVTVAVDATAPTVATTSATDPVTSATGGVTLAGTVEAGARVELTASDGVRTAGPVLAVVAGTSWTAGPLDVGALADGLLTFSVTAVDSAANTAVVTRSATKDTAVTPLTVTALTDPLTAVAAEATTISGTVEAGSSVDVVVADAAGRTVAAEAVVTGSTWTTPALDLRSLADGALTVAVHATDAHGNQGDVTTSTTKSSVNRYAVTTPASATAGTAVTVGLTAVRADGSTDTTVTGWKPVTFTGPAARPSGTNPTFPSQVRFTAGVATASVTLVDAGTTAVTATTGTTTGTSAAVSVQPGAAARLAWSEPVLSAGSASSPCLFTCTVTSFGNASTFTASVAVTDGWGNVVSDLGSGHRVRVTESGSGSVTPTSSLTFPSTGPAVTATVVVFRSRAGGSFANDTMTASTSSGTTYTSATAKFSR